MPKIAFGRINSGDGKISFHGKDTDNELSEGQDGSADLPYTVVGDGGPDTPGGSSFDFSVQHNADYFKGISGLVLQGQDIKRVYRDKSGRAVVTITADVPPPDKRYDLAFSVPGATIPGNAFLFTTPRAFTFPSGLTGSVASALTNAASTTKYDLYRKAPQAEPVLIGTMTFGSGMSTATFAFPEEVTFEIGDMFYVHLEIDDATLTDLAVTLLATLKQ